MSHEEDTRLRTEDREEDDEKEFEERPVMSSVSINKLQILWDHFIHAEPQSYEVYYFWTNFCRRFKRLHFFFFFFFSYFAIMYFQLFEFQSQLKLL